jgi:hypothetical protein
LLDCGDAIKQRRRPSAAEGVTGKLVDPNEAETQWHTGLCTS